MKRINNLFDTIISLENLHLAYEKARQGKGNTYGVRLYEKDLDNNLQQLQMELSSGTYRTSEYDVFTIYEPKERIIYRLPFKDRIVHHAIMIYLEPLWVPVFISGTYSCIKGRGIHGAANDVKKALRNEAGTQYCLKMDIRKFYPSVDHDVMKTIIRKKIKDARLLILLDEIIDSAPGLPIGNYLSQFLANLYLSYFDHWLKEVKCIRYYFRYADDMVILHSSKSFLHELRADIGRYLSDNLQLDLKGNYQVFPVNARGIDFVGYVFFHSHVLLRKSIKVRFCRKAARLNRMNLDSKDYRMRLAPWIGWAKHCNSRHLIKSITDNEKIL